MRCSVRFATLGLIAVVSVLGLGCGKPSMTTLTGQVRFNGKPVAKCKIALFPDVAEFDPTRHGYGLGVTDENGNYEVQHPQGEKGIFPGTYKVTFTLWVDKKGKVLPYDTKPSEVEGGVKNMFPEQYENLTTTPERVTVPSGGTTKDFDITG